VWFKENRGTVRIIKYDKKTGELRLKPESLDDLFHLNLLLSNGDLVSGRTARRVTIKRGDIFERGEKRPVTLTVRAETIGFAESSGKLRVTGEIVRGTDVGKHHTIEMKPGTIVTIQKKWRQYELRRLNQLQEKPPKLLICVIDDTGADFAMLTDRLKYLTRIKGVTGKSYGEADKTEYLKSVIAYIEKYDCSKVVAGPGFTKEDIVSRLREKGIEVYQDSVAHTGKTGINELIKRGIVDRVVKDSRVSEETHLVEKFLEELSKDGKAVYGIRAITKAVDMGAVETLLVSDKLLRKLEPVMTKAEQMKTRVAIISSDHESGEKLYNLGGVAGILRYKV